MAELDRVRNTANRAADAAGWILREKLGNLSGIDYKSAFNIVTEADKAAESEVIQTIREIFPNHKILGEESGALDADSADHRWIIDPLDGTTNFAHGYPFFCVSIAFEEKGEVIFGLVFNPVNNERFQAEKGAGAFLNGQQIIASSVETLDASLLATGFPPDSKNAKYSNMQEFQHLTDLCHGVRRDGSAALDLCYVACGRLDGFWEFKLNAWDVAAGALIIREAGGIVTCPSGCDFEMESGHILASNGIIHEELQRELNKISEHARALAK
jgi:myo-inositol-1(or 4)-monophosphatase